jgi:hypothetical protein
MATYRKVSRLIPLAERAASITAVVDNDEIDIVDVLGRPARGVKIIPDDPSDSISLRFNNKIRIPAVSNDRDSRIHRDIPGDAVTKVSEGEHHSEYTVTGESAYYVMEGLVVSFIQISNITFGAGGSAISIEVW